MPSSNAVQLAEVIGVPGAATRILSASTLSAEDEQFLREHLNELSWDLLLNWLSREEPTGVTARPHPLIVARVLEQLREGALLLALHPAVLERVRPPEVRDEIVAGLRGITEEGLWLSLVGFAVGGRVFGLVRDCEKRAQNGEGGPPPSLLEPGPVPQLVSLLFDNRRDDRACLKALTEAVSLDRTRFYVHWLLQQTGLLREVGTLEALLGSVPMLTESEPHRRSRTEFLSEIARSWPVEDERRQWFVRRALSAVNRGVSWGHVWWETPPSYRDDVALASLEAVSPAPWTMGAVVRRLTGWEAWSAVFALHDHPHSEANAFNAVEDIAKAAPQPTSGRQVPSKEDFDAAIKAVAQSWMAWTDLALPPDADDAFEERFVRISADLGADFVVSRLITLPLTKSRAARILNLALEDGSFWQLERGSEIARLVGPVDADIPLPRNPNDLEVYRLLVGASADERLHDGLVEYIRREQWLVAIPFADMIVELVSPDDRDELRRLASKTSISELAGLCHDYPWLFSETDVVREATLEGQDRWGMIEVLPPYLAPVMEAAAARTEDQAFASLLLDRLETLGTPRRSVLSIALERIKMLGAQAVHPRWLGSKLHSGSLWEEPGGDLVAALLERGGGRMLTGVCLAATASAGGSHLVLAMHTTIGRVLIRFAKEALQQSDQDRALRALTALAHLSPRSGLRVSVLALAGLNPNDEVGGLIELNGSLLRRSGGSGGNDLATIASIGEALAVLVNGEGSAP